jgi:TetR/AcrR family transcriptional regulator, regulator of cefoperazone and chloramphenicol sensitivity
VQTETRLLDVAERLFAARGFAATSVRDITTAAGCNLAAVSYHFGSKLGLYAEVMRRRFSSLRERRLAGIREARPDNRDDALESVLRAFALAFLEPLLADGQGRLVTELLAREMLDPQLPTEMFWQEIAGPVRDALSAALRGVAPALREGDARLCVLSIVGQLVQATHNRRLAETGAVPADVPTLMDNVEHVVRFSAAGVRACAGERAEPARLALRRRQGR